MSANVDLARMIDIRTAASFIATSRAASGHRCHDQKEDVDDSSQDARGSQRLFKGNSCQSKYFKKMKELITFKKIIYQLMEK